MEQQGIVITEQALFEHYEQTRSEVLRNQILEKYLYIAEIVAKKFVGRGVEYDDLFQVASLALVKALDRFAKRAGLLFQVVDDILDCTASTATLGKTAGKDAAAEKPTYVSLMGLERAREFADDLRTQALESLSLFGARGQRLIELTDFITHRSF